MIFINCARSSGGPVGIIGAAKAAYPLIAIAVYFIKRQVVVQKIQPYIAILPVSKRAGRKKRVPGGYLLQFVGSRQEYLDS